MRDVKIAMISLDPIAVRYARRNRNANKTIRSRIDSERSMLKV